LSTLFDSEYRVFETGCMKCIPCVERVEMTKIFSMALGPQMASE
jgi:hypothetical protein